jgi:hypothetical protein
MTYTVTWKKLPSEQLIHEEGYQTLDEALAEAKLDGMGGASAVEITVTDEDGKVQFSRILNNAQRK